MMQLCPGPAHQSSTKMPQNTLASILHDLQSLERMAKEVELSARDAAAACDQIRLTQSKFVLSELKRTIAEAKTEIEGVAGVSHSI